MANPVSSVNRSNHTDQAQSTQRSRQTDRKQQAQAPKQSNSVSNQDKVTLSKSQPAKQNRDRD